MEENDVIESEAVTENNEPAQEIESNEPESMLEAITEGLKAEETEKKPEETEPKAEETPEETQENDDTPPEGISKKAQERFHNLTHRLKEKDAELSSVRADLDGIRQVMRETGAKAEDFGLMFDYMKCLNKGDMDSVGRILAEQVKQYTLMTGKQLGAPDPLTDFPDLRERVSNYQMDEQSALEIARQRAWQHEQQQQAASQRQQHQSAIELQQMRQMAMQKVDMMGAEWAKRDPDYRAKEDVILKQIPQIAKQFPPAQWAQQVELLYQTLSAMPIPKPQNTPQPLRASGQAGGAKQPASMLDALKTGLGY